MSTPHVARRIEAKNLFGPRVYRVACSCGWFSMWAESQGKAIESWDWHREHGAAPEPQVDAEPEGARLEPLP